ncbi:hypothetical protein [Nocardioides soli]|uniref:hypothetical protein n=1 Tax=Nocardioides soli TaxID=1036020 RepID=UPI001618391A|nr:hypothetical protein [Nocardioides soli]
MTEEPIFGGYALTPADMTAWLRIQGWEQTGALGDVAQRWRNDSVSVVVPMLTSSPDFTLRWSELLDRLSDGLDTDPAGVLLAVAKSGSDIAEFRATGQIDDSLPLGDAATLIESVRRAMQASANSALQPRSYYGHSLPDAARDHARNVRMGQTRRGSYIVPVISRLPILEPDDADDAVLFDEVAFQPFARTAMLRLAKGLKTLHDLTHGASQPTRSSITEAIGEGVSSELCDAVASTLEAHSIVDLDVTFAWAERLPESTAPAAVTMEDGSAPMIRQVSSVLKGEPIVGRQTFVGYVKRLDRGEEDEVGRITLRALDNDKARNITIDLNDDDYHVAGEANTDRRMVSVTGVLHREPGRALRFTEVSEFHLLEGFPSLFEEADRPQQER